MKKAAYLVLTQYDNLGDLIINKCLIDELSKHVDLYIDTTNITEEFSERFTTNSKVKVLKDHYQFVFKDISIIKFFLKKDRAFDFLFKSPGPIVVKKAKTLKGIITRFVLNYALKTAYRKGTDCYVIGSEIGFKTDEDISRFKKESHYFTKYYLRSISNVKHMKSLGIKNVEYIPDLCFLMADQTKISENKTKVGISFRDLENHDLNKNIEESVDIFIKFYLNKGMTIVFFYQVKRDYEYNRKLYSKYKDREEIIFNDECLDYDKINFYSDISAVISNRLHVLLLGFIHKALTYPIIDSNSETKKIEGIYQSIGSTIKPLGILNQEQLIKHYESMNALHIEIEKINETQNRIAKKYIGDIFN